jgi:hypothetical protein
MSDNDSFSPLCAQFENDDNVQTEQLFCNNCGRELTRDECICSLKARTRRATNDLVEETANQMSLYETLGKILNPEYEFMKLSNQLT